MSLYFHDNWVGEPRARFLNEFSRILSIVSNVNLPFRIKKDSVVWRMDIRGSSGGASLEPRVDQETFELLHVLFLHARFVTNQINEHFDINQSA